MVIIMYVEGLASRLCFVRKRCDYSLDFVCVKTEICREYLEMFEDGTMLPSLEDLATLSNLYDVSIDWLLSSSEKLNDFSNHAYSIFRFDDYVGMVFSESYFNTFTYFLNARLRPNFSDFGLLDPLRNDCLNLSLFRRWEDE